MAHTILLIEDDEGIRELYSRALKNAGFEVIAIQDGERGVAALSSELDLVLLDVMLPGMNGMDVLKAIRATPETKDVPVIMMTNLDQDKVRERAEALGASNYIVKIDISPMQLIEMVRAILV